MMLAITFASRAACTSRVDAVNLAMGYPKPGEDIGSGVHVPAALSATTSYTYAIKHPTLAQWAMFVDTKVQNELSAPEKGAVVVLDASWVPVVADVATATEIAP